MQSTRSILLLCAWVPALATSAQDHAAEHLSMWQQRNRPAWQNPALHAYAFETSLSTLQLSADYSKQQEAFIEEKGTGHLLPKLKAETYLRLSPRTTVWGAASYMNGKTRRVRWNSGTDYDLLRPYILADTLGGDTHREQYRFSGGYGTEAGHVRLGGEMLFRAEQEWRTHDPRMRAIVSDLTLRAGAAYPVSHYLLAVGVEANIYKQTDNVDFYAEAGGITEYQMTGLGTYQARFSGAETDIYIKGGGIGVNLDFRSNQSNTPFAHVTADRHNYRRISESQNDLPLTTLYRHHINLQAGWQHEAKHRWAAFAGFDYARRSGDEHIAGDATGGSYPVLTDLTMYKNYLMDASLHALYGRKAAVEWTVQAQGGILTNRERYIYPERRMDVSHAYGQVSGQLHLSATHSLSFLGEISAAHYHNFHRDIVMPYANMQAYETIKINREYTYRQAHYTLADARFRANYQLPASVYGFFAEVGGGAVLCSESNHQTHLRLSIGVSF